jgi:hypothetical protein
MGRLCKIGARVLYCWIKEFRPRPDLATFPSVAVTDTSNLAGNAEGPMSPSVIVQHSDADRYGVMDGNRVRSEWGTDPEIVRRWWRCPRSVRPLLL